MHTSRSPRHRRASRVPIDFQPGGKFDEGRSNGSRRFVGAFNGRQLVDLAPDREALVFIGVSATEDIVNAAGARFGERLEIAARDRRFLRWRWRPSRLTRESPNAFARRSGMPALFSRVTSRTLADAYVK